MNDFFAPLPARRLFAALAVFALALVAMSWPRDETAYRAVFSPEDGLFDRAAPALWLGLALARAVQATPLADGRGRGTNLVVMAAIAALMAMREADWHADAGVILLVGCVLALRATWLCVRTLRHRAAWREPWGWTLAIALSVAALVRMLEPLQATAHRALPVALPGQLERILGAWQAGFACALPLMFGLALWQWRQSLSAALPLEARSPGVEAFR